MAEKIFTYAVLAYNQAEMIVETLNSIRYQIENYGQGICFNLFVVDDASKDNTVEVVERWVQQNGSYFANVCVTQNLENKGVPYNFNYLLNLLQGEKFKIIAGDDLISSDNLLLAYEGMNDTVLRTFCKICFTDGKIYYHDKSLREHFYKIHHGISSKQYLKNMRRGGFLHTPSTIYSKELYDNAGCKAFNMQFSLFEDDPTWYTMIKNEPDLKIEFKPEAIVLYRIHNKSISNSGTRNTPFQNELNKLHQIYCEDCCGFERLYQKSRLWNLPKFLRLHAYVDKLHDLYIKYYTSVLFKKAYKSYEAWIVEYVKRQQLFYDALPKEM